MVPVFASKLRMKHPHSIKAAAWPTVKGTVEQRAQDDRQDEACDIRLNDIGMGEHGFQ